MSDRKGKEKIRNDEPNEDDREGDERIRAHRRNSKSKVSRQAMRAFKQFPANFSTFHDGIEHDFSADELMAMQKAIEKQVRLANAAVQAAGGTVSPEALAEIAETYFGNIPEALIPPQFVPELQDWRNVRDEFLRRQVAARPAPPEESSGGLSEGLDATGEHASRLSEALGYAGSIASTIGIYDADEGEAIVSLMQTGADETAQASEVAGAAVDVRDDAAQRHVNPLKQRMQDEKTLGSAAKLGLLCADAGAEFVPVLGTVKDGAQCINAITGAIQRNKMRAVTGALRDEASMDATSQLAKAFEQSQNRETRLLVESVVQAVIKGIATGVGIMRDVNTFVSGAPDPGVAVTVNAAMSKGSDAAFALYDAHDGARAIDMLDRARAGDVTAQIEIFRKHAHYAKMLIALAAQQGNEQARDYLHALGASDADMMDESTTVDLLFEYTLHRSKEKEEPGALFQKAMAWLERAQGLADSIAEGCAVCMRWLGVLEDEPEAAMPEIQRIPSAGGIIDMCQFVIRSKQIRAQLGAVETLGGEKEWHSQDLAEKSYALQERLAHLQQDIRNLEVAAGQRMAAAKLRYAELELAAEKAGGREDPRAKPIYAEMARLAPVVKQLEQVFLARKSLSEVLADGLARISQA